MDLQSACLQHRLHIINTISVHGDQKDETPLLKDEEGSLIVNMEIDSEEIDKNADILMKDAHFVGPAPTSQNILKTRKGPIVSFQTTAEIDLETLTKEEIWQGVAKRMSTQLQDLGQDKSSRDIIHSLGKSMRDFASISGSMRKGGKCEKK